MLSWFTGSRILEVSAIIFAGLRVASASEIVDGENPVPTAKAQHARLMNAQDDHSGYHSAMACRAARRSVGRGGTQAGPEIECQQLGGRPPEGRRSERNSRSRCVHQ
jgi:hypothetical protein